MQLLSVPASGKNEEMLVCGAGCKIVAISGSAIDRPAGRGEPRREAPAWQLSSEIRVLSERFSVRHPVLLADTGRGAGVRSVEG